MADELTPGEDLLSNAPLANREFPADSIALRIKSWYIEAAAHPLWRNYVRESDEDEGYYHAQDFGAWSVNGSTEDARALSETGRPVVSIRHIKPQVDVLVGTERQNRMDLRALPQGDEDEDDARIMTHLLKWTSDQLEVNDIISEGFKDGLIRGMSAFDVGIDWEAWSESAQGEIYVRRLRPGKNLIWDPMFEKYDLSDCRYMLEYRWVWVEDVITQYPDMEEEIRSAIGRLVPVSISEMTTTDGGVDAYGSTSNHPIEAATAREMFYDPAMRNVLVLTAWYRAYETVHVVTDKITSKLRTFSSEDEANRFAATDPQNLTAKVQRRRRIKTATVLPATLQELDPAKKSPYDNDPEHYPIVAFIADRTGNVIEGLVRGLKDPTRIENKRISQAVELAQKYGSMRPIVEEGAVLNPESLDNPGDQSPIQVRPGRMGGVGWFQPQGLVESVRVHESIANDMKNAMREVGPNVDLLGGSGQAVSGIAIARRQIQSQTTMFPYYDQHRRTRKLVGERLARRIQQVFTTDRTIRILGPYGEPRLVRINPAEYQDAARKDDLTKLREASRLDPTKPEILRSMEALKFDIVISEAPATPTARAALVDQLVTVVDKYQTIFPFIADTIFELLPDLPNRAQILQRIKAWQGRQGIGDQAAAPAPPATPPPPGAPPGGAQTPPGVPRGAAPAEMGVTVAPQPPPAAAPLPGVPVGALPGMGATV